MRRLNVPGPGAYDLRSSGKCVSESAPAYTFGTRPKGRKTDMAPAPNNYSLPPIVGHKHVNQSSAPQYTMVSRKKVGGFDEDLKKVGFLLVFQQSYFSNMLVRSGGNLSASCCKDISKL